MDKLYSEKFKNLVLYILENNDYQDEGIKKLNKILYFIDFYFYREHERSISDARYAKAGMGPIVDNYKEIFQQLDNDGVLKQLSENGRIFHKPKGKADKTIFSSEEIDHIRNILDKYGKLSAAELESISHDQQPWVLTRQAGDIIDPDLALLIDDGNAEDIEVTNEQMKKELVDLANNA